MEILRHAANPYFTTLMNSPEGVNLAANTSVTTYAVLLVAIVVLLRESEPGRRATLRGLAVPGSWFLLIAR